MRDRTDTRIVTLIDRGHTDASVIARLMHARDVERYGDWTSLEASYMVRASELLEEIDRRPLLAKINGSHTNPK